MCAAHQLWEVGERVLTKPERQKVHLFHDALGEIKEYLCHFIVTMAFLGYCSSRFISSHRQVAMSLQMAKIKNGEQCWP